MKNACNEGRRLLRAILPLLVLLAALAVPIAVLPAPVTADGVATPMVAATLRNTLGLKNDGTAITAGTGEESVLVGFSDLERVDAGFNHNYGIKTDGTVVAAGTNTFGQCDVGDWTGITQVASGWYHAVGLKSDGTLVSVGENYNGQRNLYHPGSPPTPWDGITQVAAGWQHTVALCADGQVEATGINHVGQCDVGYWSAIEQIAAGWQHTVGLRSDGTVVATGDDAWGESSGVSTWNGITQVAAGSGHTVGLKADGTVVAVGDNSSGQCEVDSWTGITQIAAGEYHTVGLRADGTVVAVGDNSYLQCETSDWDLLNVAPGRPTNVWPAEGGTGLNLTPTLQSSDSSDADVGDTHAASQWQIRRVSGNYLSPVFDSGADTSNLTSITMPSGVLDWWTTYYWRVRHQDNHGAWSEYSVETSFTTASETASNGWYEQSTVSNSANSVRVGHWVYQTFTPSAAHNFNTVSLYLCKVGRPSYTVTVALYNVDGDHKPVAGDPLCSTTFAASSVATTAAWRILTFSTGYHVSAGTEYALVLSGDGGTTSSYVAVRMSTADPYSGGLEGKSTTGGSTWDVFVPAQDIAFREAQFVEALGWYEQYTVSNSANSVRAGHWVYQTFTPSAGHYFNAVSLNLYKYGSPNYTVTIALYNADGDHKPVAGAPLCSMTLAASSLTTTPTWRSYNFSTGCQLTAGTEYALVLSADGGSTSSYVAVRMNSADGYGGGLEGKSTNGGSTWEVFVPAQDISFREGQY